MLPGYDSFVDNSHRQSIPCGGKLRMCEQHFPDVSHFANFKSGELETLIGLIAQWQRSGSLNDST